MIPERPVTIPVSGGLTLEGALSLPPGAPAGVVVCHPHPRFGGDMDSHVVVTAVEACAGQGLATLRFNFRGVAESGGGWDEGRGERDDVRAALAHLRGCLTDRARIGLAGYSFGAAIVAAVAAGGEPLAALALIAPPVGAPSWPGSDVLVAGTPVLVVAGSRDTYCPAPALAALADAAPAATVTVIDGADHFFSSGLGQLHAALSGWAAKLTA
jgi:alpha/beta superfamily hydrolase